MKLQMPKIYETRLFEESLNKYDVEIFLMSNGKIKGFWGYNGGEFENGELFDYDGAYSLSNSVIELLKKAGFKIGEFIEWEKK